MNVTRIADSGPCVLWVFAAWLLLSWHHSTALETKETGDGKRSSTSCSLLTNTHTCSTNTPAHQHARPRVLVLLSTNEYVMRFSFTYQRGPYPPSDMALALTTTYAELQWTV